MLVEIRTDYDFKDIKVLMSMIEGIKLMHRKKLKQILIRRSSNNHFHVKFIVWLPDDFKRLDKISLMIGLRLGFADDYGRCLHDMFRNEMHLSTDKLFYAKLIRKNGVVKFNKVGKWELYYELIDENSDNQRKTKQKTNTRQNTK